MEESSSGELVFIPWPVMGHVQIVEFANLIINRQNTISTGTKIHLHFLGQYTIFIHSFCFAGTRKLSVTVLLMKLPDYVDTVSGSFLDKLTNEHSPRVNFFHLPPTEAAPEWSSRTRGFFIHNLVLSQRSNVAEFIRKSNAVSVVVDMLCTPMIDVAEEFDLPSYVFFTSPASFLGAMLHFQVLHDEKKQDVFGLKNSGSDLQIPSLENPFPPQALPLVLVEKDLWLERFLHYARDYRRAKGIIINTFAELESFALDSFSQDSAYGRATIPPIYPVGPILNQTPSSDSRSPEIIRWLDEQPARSVVLVCFGSQGSLHVDQVKELANGLERSGHRFLWALRRQSPDEKRAVFPSEYISHAEVLPDGFLDRTCRMGKVVGWVPQLDVLSHKSIGGFVSHCGWNSVLESVWCGVPIATWPLHAEQQMNSFQVARDLRLGLEITLSYHERCEDGEMVKASQVESGIRELMDGASEARKRMEKMSEELDFCDGRRVFPCSIGSAYYQFSRHFLTKMLSLSHSN